MMAYDDFWGTVRSFLTIYLPKQRCYSDNTIKSYRQALNLLVEYLRTEKGLKVSQISFALFDRQLVGDFLDWLQETRFCSTSSRNQRFMVLRSFFKYAGVMDCAQIAIHEEIKKVPVKKGAGHIVEFLTEDALQALLAQPDTQKLTGIRNRCFMILMHDIAARCSEMLDLKVRDLRLNTKHPMVYLTGKGNKMRTVPIMPKAVEHCKHYLTHFHPAANQNGDDYLFYTTTNGVHHRMSSDNAEKFMKKYGEMAKQFCPEMPERVHPHQLRHTRAIHLYRDGMPLQLLAEWLGHADVETTKIYAYADTEMKRVAIQKTDRLRTSAPPPEPIWIGDEEMILKLSGL